ncbi:Glycosyltransferase 1 domain-containing protein 1 [Trichoplax sp. H2]|nr:Glycosyltransferase 1 domain-containing protein 1 [Trichoplax sp. H2]|eukprot:RDD41084.1 Glycosyltransferase 1 domain-containing protein 1 [Trichoplax sp. H2]
MPSVLLLYSSKGKECGNSSTSERLRKLLNHAGIGCTCKQIADFTGAPSLNNYLQGNHFNCVIGIHAYRTGNLLISCCLPYAIVFAGTDLNTHIHDAKKMPIITEAVLGARYLIAFTRSHFNLAMAQWPTQINNIIKQPQSVVTNPQNTFSFKAHLQEKLGMQEQNLQNITIFLLVAGIRPIKDPLFLADAVSEWHRKDPSIYLVIIGPEIDTEFSYKMKENLLRYTGVYYVDSIPQPKLHMALRQCTALVNSSINEGMCGVILEAMNLGTPVIARRNAGNCEIVDHLKTGLLFNTPEEFIGLAKYLLSSHQLRDALVRHAVNYVEAEHSLSKEMETYCNIVHTISGKGL